jgi:hypothetical protein
VKEPFHGRDLGIEGLLSMMQDLTWIRSRWTGLYLSHHRVRVEVLERLLELEVPICYSAPPIASRMSSLHFKSIEGVEPWPASSGR